MNNLLILTSAHHSYTALFSFFASSATNFIFQIGPFSSLSSLIPERRRLLEFLLRECSAIRYGMRTKGGCKRTFGL